MSEENLKNLFILKSSEKNLVDNNFYGINLGRYRVDNPLCFFYGGPPNQGMNFVNSFLAPLTLYCANATLV